MLAALFAPFAPVPGHRGWPRVAADADCWRGIGAALREGKLDLLALWGDERCVHCALYEPATRRPHSASLEVHDGRVPSLAQFHAPALRLERACADLYGIEAVGLPDARPWLDHGRWPRRHPLAAAPQPPVPPARYEFLPAEGPSLHQIAVGPVHAGIIEPGHFRFNASGETVVRLEERLGYTHKGIEGLLRGRSPEEGARLAGRVSGDSTVAYSFAFARAVEAALGVAPPPRALWLRAVMAELERIANHLGDIGAVCNDAAFAMMHAECAILRERVLRAAALAFGHRLMMDCVVPGGVAADLAPGGLEALRGCLGGLKREFPELIELYENTASLQDRTVGAGVVSAALAAEFAAPGFVGRASGRAFDARSCLPYPPYDSAPVPIALREEGDVDARVWVRILEVGNSLTWLQAVLGSLPGGPVRVPCVAAPGVEGVALVEGFRGDILAYVRIGPERTLERCHLRDPSWLQWPLLEAAIEGNIVADFPLCNKSFNCSYSGHDL
ncbi:MAG TPA: NADH-quinone oxidoreductase subunit C [Steroidobacteraceae bacterium]|nr:NADH-quinone oxidoreductase subunit C [Steroidobacteraceae bacterium]